MQSLSKVNALIASVGLLTLGSICHAVPLIVNGDFETGDFTGWVLSVDSNGTEVFPSGLAGIVAESGNFYAALGNTGALGHLSQSFTSVPGKYYLLDYFLASDGRIHNEFVSVAAGNTLYSVINLPHQLMTEYSFTFKATAALTTIDFGSINRPGFLGLDSVSVTAILPEPGAYSLGLVALLMSGMGIGLVRRKRSTSCD